MTAPSRQPTQRRRLAIVTTLELAPGYRLAGVATRAATSPAEAIERLRELIAESGDEAIVAIHEPFLQTLDPAARRRLEESTTPLVVPLPAGEAQESQSERREQLLRMLWQAIGYQITFEPKERE